MHSFLGHTYSLMTLSILKEAKLFMRNDFSESLLKSLRYHLCYQLTCNVAEGYRPEILQIDWVLFFRDEGQKCCVERWVNQAIFLKLLYQLKEVEANCIISFQK